MKNKIDEKNRLRQKQFHISMEEISLSNNKVAADAKKCLKKPIHIYESKYINFKPEMSNLCMRKTFILAALNCFQLMFPAASNQVLLMLPAASSNQLLRFFQFLHKHELKFPDICFQLI